MSGEPSTIKPQPPDFTNKISSAAVPVSEFSSHPTLKTGTIEPLKPPGPDSNYSEWSWVLDIHF
jgi:hypothetical protein